MQSWVDASSYPHGGGEELLGDMEALNITNMRPDIHEAMGAAARVKAKLGYKDTEELDTGLQKVQPLKFLDEEIEEYYQQIKDSVPLAQQANDEVPQRVLAKVDHVINIAHERKVGLFKSSELLAGSSKAYQYAREASRDTFDLQRRSQLFLDKQDESFKQMIACRIQANVQDGEKQEKECFEHLKVALEEAHGDVQSHKERVSAEDKTIRADVLREAHDAVREDVKEERGQLNHIQTQCATDMATIGAELQQLHHRMNVARDDYRKEEERRNQQLDKNKARQEQLRMELKMLEDEERSLERDLRDGRRLQEEAARAEEEATREMTEWKEKISELKGKADASLEVMQHMEECTQWIMEDAKKHKRAWKEKLDRLELESLLSLRDAIMASGVMRLQVINDCQQNQQHIEKELADTEREKKRVAQTGYASRVQELKAHVQKKVEERELFEKRVGETSNQLARLREELTKVDERVRELRPSITLDSMEDRFRERKEQIGEAFEKENVTGISFCSRFNYSA